MTTEQVLSEKWRGLSPPKQQEVLDFGEFLESKQAIVKTDDRSPLRSYLAIAGKKST
jgi:hypothetical protein